MYLSTGYVTDAADRIEALYDLRRILSCVGRDAAQAERAKGAAWDQIIAARSILRLAQYVCGEDEAHVDLRIDMVDPGEEASDLDRVCAQIDLLAEIIAHEEEIMRSAKRTLDSVRR